MSSESKWIVTGGAGFIGCNASRALFERGVEVVVLDDLSRPSAPVNLEWLQTETNKGVTFVGGDVRERGVVENLVREHADANVVLHLAAQVAVTTSITHPRNDFYVNGLGTFNVLESVRRFLPDSVVMTVSTNKVYGGLAHHRIEEQETRYVDRDFPLGIPEDYRLDPHSPYGCSKAVGDLYALDFARTYGLRSVVLRQSCIYGPRQFGIEDQGWAAWFAIAAMLGRDLTVFGSGKQVRDLLHVDDLVDLYLRMAEHGSQIAGKVYNVGGGPKNTLSLLELLHWMEKRDLRPSLSFEAARPADQRVFICDISSLERDLGWHPRIGVDQGIDDLFQWVESHSSVAKELLPER